MRALHPDKIVALQKIALSQRRKARPRRRRPAQTPNMVQRLAYELHASRTRRYLPGKRS